MSDFFNYISNPKNAIVIIAEMAWAHDGSMEKAKKIVKGAFDAGADLINFHITSLENYMVKSYGLGEGKLSNTESVISSVFHYLENINLDFDEIANLSAYATTLGIKTSVMCNDLESLEFATKEIKSDLIIIHPSCLTDDDFVRKVAVKNVPTVLYCGGLLLGEIEKAIHIFREEQNTQIILQHGFQSYPTRIEDNNLSYLKTLGRTFGYPIAFGDHTDGGDPFAMIVPLLAIPYGIRMIEKHITYDRNEKGEDFESALDIKDFQTFVKYVRDAEKAIGNYSNRSLSERELKYRQVVMKRTVAKCNIEKGAMLSLDNITFKRSDAGILPAEASLVRGSVRFNKELLKDSPIRWEDIS